MNKKGAFGIRLFGFLFAVMIIMAVLFFFLTAFPAILHQYGIMTLVDVNQDLIDMGVSGNSSSAGVLNIAEGYKNIYKVADYMFMFFILSLMISSVVAAARAKREGIMSFFGLITLGNVVLIFLLTFAVRISDWVLNELVYRILNVSISTPFALWFFDYNLYIGFIWYTVLLLVNIVDFKAIGSKFGFVSEDDEDKVRFQQ